MSRVARQEEQLVRSYNKLDFFFPEWKGKKEKIILSGTANCGAGKLAGTPLAPSGANKKLFTPWSH